MVYHYNNYALIIPLKMLKDNVPHFLKCRVCDFVSNFADIFAHFKSNISLFSPIIIGSIITNSLDTMIDEPRAYFQNSLLVRLERCCCNTDTSRSMIEFSLESFFFFCKYFMTFDALNNFRSTKLA